MELFVLLRLVPGPRLVLSPLRGRRILSRLLLAVLAPTYLRQGPVFLDFVLDTHVDNIFVVLLVCQVEGVLGSHLLRTPHRLEAKGLLGNAVLTLLLRSLLLAVRFNLVLALYFLREVLVRVLA